MQLLIFYYLLISFPYYFRAYNFLYTHTPHYCWFKVRYFHCISLSLWHVNSFNFRTKSLRWFRRRGKTLLFLDPFLPINSSKSDWRISKAEYFLTGTNNQHFIDKLKKIYCHLMQILISGHFLLLRILFCTFLKAATNNIWWKLTYIDSPAWSICWRLWLPYTFPFLIISPTNWTLYIKR